MRGATRFIGASLWLFVLGCNHRPLALADDAGGGPPPPPRDMARPPTVSGDLAWSPPDLADACRLDEANANVALGAETFTYVWLGNRDAGGESSCGRPTIVYVFLSNDPSSVMHYPPTGQYASFTLEQPLQLGTRSVTLTTDDGSKLTVTLDIEGFTLYPDGGGFVRTLEGKLEASELGLSGPLRAGHCPELDFICV